MKVSAPTGRSANSPAKLSKRSAERRVQQDDRHSADRHPDDGEEHHRRELQADRHRLGDGDDHEQGRKDGQKQDDIEHGGRDLYPVAASGGKIAPGSMPEHVAMADGEPRRPPRRWQPSGGQPRLGRFFGSYGQRSTSTQTPHKRLARHADVAPVQDQPVMGVQQETAPGRRASVRPRPRAASCPARWRGGWRGERHGCRPRASARRRRC